MTLPIEPAANGRAIPSMELLTFDVISVAEDVELPVNSSLVEEVKFEDAATFAAKVATIKEGFFSDSDSSEEELTESSDSQNVKTIVEGQVDANSKMSSDMQRYVSTLSRFK